MSDSIENEIKKDNQSKLTSFFSVKKRDFANHVAGSMTDSAQTSPSKRKKEVNTKKVDRNEQIAEKNKTKKAPCNKKTTNPKKPLCDEQTTEDMEIDSEPSISEPGAKGKSKVNYLLGEGIKEWTREEDYVVGKVNLTKSLEAFRKKSILLAEGLQPMNSVQILSLSFIFPVNTYDNSLCITSQIKDKGFKKAVTDLAYSQDTFNLASWEATEYCEDVVKACKSRRSFYDLDPPAGRVHDKHVYELVHELVTKGGKMKAKRKGATFIENHIMLYLHEVFAESRDFSTFTKINEDQKSDVREPDGVICYDCEYDYEADPGKFNKTKILLVEIEKDLWSNRAQPEDSYINLMKFMKAAIETQVEKNVSSPVMFGMLCRGSACELYRMRILAEGVYMVVLMKKFTLPHQIPELVDLPKVVEAFYHIFETILDLRYVCPVDEGPIPESLYMKPSFSTEFIE